MFRLYLKGKGFKGKSFTYLLGEKKTLYGIGRVVKETIKKIEWESNENSKTPDWTVLQLFEGKKLLSNIGV